MQALTTSALARIHANETVSAPVLQVRASAGRPTLMRAAGSSSTAAACSPPIAAQILEVKKISTQGQAERFRLNLSDGVNHCTGMLSQNLNDVSVR